MRIGISLIFLAVLGFSLPSEAQKPSAKSSRHSSKKPKTVQKKANADLNTAPSTGEVIPEESSLHADVKKTRKVVIVPAPPPPPGNDPIPPKRNP